MNGYCYFLSNEQRLSIIPKTKIVYMLLLDMVLVNATTFQTSIIQPKNCFLNMDKGFAFIYVTNNYIALLRVSYGITLN